MMHKQLFWLGSLVTAGIFTLTISATATTNQSDTSGGNNHSGPPTNQSDTSGGNNTSGPPTNQSDTSGGNNTGSPPNDEDDDDEVPANPQYNSSTGMASGGALRRPIYLGFGNNFGNASGTGSANQTTEVTLNEVAEALQKNLQQSLDNLAAAEDKAKSADSSPRRITRRSSEAEARECINPVYEARQMAERQLEETKKFIEQVNQIEPEKNLW